MKVARAGQMKLIDRLAQEKYGMPGLVLMERAALAVLKAIKEQLGDFTQKKIYLFCGKGNNGGDGLALSRLLLETDAEVTAVLIFDREQYRGLALENLERAEHYGVRVILWRELNLNELQTADLLVDALLGTGTTGVPTGVIAEVIETLNKLKKTVIAVDLPSGIDVDTGRVDGPAIKAVLTVTFGVPKPGLLMFPGAEYTGKLLVEEIGFPRPLLESEDLEIGYLTTADLRRWLPNRPATAHKGVTGHLLVVGGAPGMTGAVALTALGALRTGAGLVTVGLRTEQTFPEKPPEIMVIRWPDLRVHLSHFRVIVFGPGLSTAQDGQVLLTDLIEEVSVPLVIDADGLNILASRKITPGIFKQPVILTPHPGEMSRLTGLSVPEIQADRLGIASKFAKEWGVTIVLKGARTVISSTAGKLFINPTGNSGMATAGMGDALAGIIGGLIAQGLTATEAAAAGVFLHGLAGDLAIHRKGPIGIITSDLFQEIPFAIKKVLLNEERSINK